MPLRDLLPGRRVRRYDPRSVGVVDRFEAHFAEPLLLRSGARLETFTLAYETYGTLNTRRDNAILICHALSGDSHVAGYYTDDPEEKPGWWDDAVGPGKMFDTSQYFVICSNVIGGCRGSTGPSSPAPDGRPYALRFPVITIADMVRAQTALLQHLGIARLFAVAGGSMGGMQALQWAVDFPDQVQNVLFIASTPVSSAQNIAFNEIGRQAIYADPHWQRGNYYGKDRPNPDPGLAVARMIGHITYMSEQSLEEKFGRRLQKKDQLTYTFETEFAVESYLHYQGYKFTERFDANSYLYITRALDYYDVSQGYGSMAAALGRTTADFLVVSFSSDWLYTRAQAEMLVQGLKQAERRVEYEHVEASFGHDSFLVEVETMERLVGDYLRRAAARQSPA
ncbi:MAG: homoserine O-acetyltransferase [Anaerolineae bacterium]|jgi:homoserine O-acetyltransferase|nr:homoserine O-acetyltransferase [Anaerolineae bacterium]